MTHDGHAISCKALRRGTSVRPGEPAHVAERAVTLTITAAEPADHTEGAHARTAQRLEMASTVCRARRSGRRMRERREDR